MEDLIIKVAYLLVNLNETNKRYKQQLEAEQQKNGKTNKTNTGT